MINKIITAALITSLATVAVAKDKNEILALDCWHATKYQHPENVAKTFKRWDNKSYEGDFCDDVHSLWNSNNIVRGSGFGCAVQRNLTVTKIKIVGTNRFGEEDNRTFSCYFTGRDYTLHTVEKHQ